MKLTTRQLIEANKDIKILEQLRYYNRLKQEGGVIQHDCFISAMKLLDNDDIYEVIRLLEQRIKSRFDRAEIEWTGTSAV